MDVLIFYEHGVREIEGITLLKHELEKRGLSVVISHFSGPSYGRHILFSRPKVVLTPWLRYDENVYRYERFFKCRPKLVNLQWEQVYSEYNRRSGLVRLAELAKNAVHLCWGQSSANQLLEQGVAPSRLFITGSLGLDMCITKYSEYYLTKDEIGSKWNLPVGYKWILYISSFGFASYDDESIKGLDKEAELSYAEMVDISKQTRELTLDWIEEFLKKDKDAIYIYRPHPTEKGYSRLKSMEEKYKNFRVISEFSVKQWIRVCDRVQLWISTSIAEILYMGKKCSIVRPLALPGQYDLDYYHDAHVITSLSSFLEDCLTESDNEFPVDAKRIREVYDQSEAEPSYKRVADVVELILDDPSYRPIKVPTDVTLRNRYRYAKYDLLSLLSDCMSIRMFFRMFLGSKNQILRNLATSASRHIATMETSRQLENFLQLDEKRTK